MKRLNPSLARVVAHLSLWFVVSCMIGYFWQGYREGHWWTVDYIVSLSIPFLLMVVTCWFGFVPRSLEYDEDGVVIHSWWKGRHAYSWDALTHYGGAFNVFLIQFGSRQAIQILGQAYPKSDWNQFKAFLKERYPDRKASGWIGPFGFKWKRKAGR